MSDFDPAPGNFTRLDRFKEAMAMGLKWDQVEEVAEVLAENHPGLDPLAVRFTDLRQWIIDSDEFDDDPKSSTEAKLEAIQMAWHEIFKEQNGG